MSIVVVEVAVVLLGEGDRVELLLQAGELGPVLGAGHRLEALAGVVEELLQHRAAREAQQRAREAQRRHLEDGRLARPGRAGPGGRGAGRRGGRSRCATVPSRSVMNSAQALDVALDRADRDAERLGGRLEAPARRPGVQAVHELGAAHARRVGRGAAPIPERQQAFRRAAPRQRLSRHARIKEECAPARKATPPERGTDGDSILL